MAYRKPGCGTVRWRGRGRAGRGLEGVAFCFTLLVNPLACSPSASFVADFLAIYISPAFSHFLHELTLTLRKNNAKNDGREKKTEAFFREKIFNRFWWKQRVQSLERWSEKNVMAEKMNKASIEQKMRNYDASCGEEWKKNTTVLGESIRSSSHGWIFSAENLKMNFVKLLNVTWLREVEMRGDEKWDR